MLRLRRGNVRGRTVYYYTNGLTSYGKNYFGRYCLEVNPTKDITIPLYRGKRKPIIRNLGLITGLLILFIMGFYIVYPIVLIVAHYFRGARNFIVDSAWVDGVRFFGWVNIVILISIILVLVFT